jgi:hypothetical protein
MPILGISDYRLYDTMQERLDLRAFDDREMGDLLSEEATEEMEGEDNG